MSSQPDLQIFASAKTMAAQLSEQLQGRISAIIDAKGKSNIALSGGRTPLDLYRNLASASLDWSGINVHLVDERWVPRSHPRSNEAFVRSAFEQARDVNLWPIFNSESEFQDVSKHLNSAYAAKTDALDVVVLGMGGDGHTASWFPHAGNLDAALTTADAYCPIIATKSDVTGDEVQRITLSLSEVRKADLIVLMLTGSQKRAVFEQAMIDGPIEDMPVRAILRARPDTLVCWAP